GTARRRADHRDDGGARRLHQLLAILRSQQAADRLRSSVIPTATVLRDGTWIETPVRNVVPGDVFRLPADDLVLADGRLLESRDLSVQQSMLTGESLPADKEASAAAPEGTTDPNARHLVFLGTSVVSDAAVAPCWQSRRLATNKDVAGM